MGWLKNLIGNTAGEVIDKTGGVIDRFVHTKEEKAQAEMALEQLRKEFELEFKKLELDAETKLLEDRASARRMYTTDSFAQKVFSLAFLAGYFALTFGLLYWLLGQVSELATLALPTWSISLISSIWGGMSAKVNTMVDFFFGGSQGERDHTKEVDRGLREAQRGAQREEE